MKPELRIDGPSLVLYDAYTATMPVQVGDALKVTGERKVAPTEAGDDESVGVAHASANTGQMVPVVILGLARVITTVDLARGDLVVPSGEARGKARKAATADLLAGKARRYGVATETKAAGKPVWIHLRSG